MSENKEQLIYKIKSNVDLDRLVESCGFEKVLQDETGKNYLFVKVIPQPLDGDVVTYMLSNFYLNEEWKKKFYNDNKKEFYDTLGLKYKKDGSIKRNIKFIEFLTSWLIVIDPEDNWIGFTSSDPHFKTMYYGTILEKYCSDILSKLQILDMVETIYA